MRLFAYLLCILFGGSSALAYSPLGHDPKVSANQIVGKVVSIGTLDDGITVRIAERDKTETFDVCPTSLGGDAMNLKETSRVKSLYEAFQHGSVVVGSFGDPFDRCLANVEIRKDQKEFEKADKKSTATVSKPKIGNGNGQFQNI